MVFAECILFSSYSENLNIVFTFSFRSATNIHSASNRKVNSNGLRKQRDLSFHNPGNYPSVLLTAINHFFTKHGWYIDGYTHNVQMLHNGTVPPFYCKVRFTQPNFLTSKMRLNFKRAIIAYFTFMWDRNYTHFIT